MKIFDKIFQMNKSSLIAKAREQLSELNPRQRPPIYLTPDDCLDHVKKILKPRYGFLKTLVAFVAAFSLAQMYRYGYNTIWPIVGVVSVSLWFFILYKEWRHQNDDLRAVCAALKNTREYMDAIHNGNGSSK